jgi:S1-C subfamily serine protease
MNIQHWILLVFLGHYLSGCAYLPSIKIPKAVVTQELERIKLDKMANPQQDPVIFAHYKVKKRDQLKNSIVKIESLNEEGTAQEGTGFLIYISPKKAYIITASHVIEGDTSPTIEFFEGNKFRSEIIEKEDGDSGIALLLVKGKIPSSANPLFLLEKRDFQSGENAFTFGFPPSGPWMHNELTYSGRKGRTLNFSGNISRSGGNSGGPVIIKNQVVGVITEVLEGQAQAVSSSSVKELLSGAKGQHGHIILNIMNVQPRSGRIARKRVPIKKKAKKLRPTKKIKKGSFSNKQERNIGKVKVSPSSSRKTQTRPNTAKKVR